MVGLVEYLIAALLMSPFGKWLITLDCEVKKLPTT